MLKIRKMVNKPHGSTAKGFTLIELLVVIAILAILAAIVVVTLNPAQLMAQARDSTRISDLSSIKSALQLYLADVSSPKLASATYTSKCYVSTTSTVAANCGGRHTGTTTTSSDATNINGAGWVGGEGTADDGPNLTDISSGAPLSSWPLDPTNNGTYFYSYAADTTNNTFEIDAKMESAKYSNGGGSDVESKDGGNSSTLYEVGSDSGLDL